MAKHSGKRGNSRQVILIFGEGETECAFINYLKSRSSHRGRVSIQVKTANGGAPEHMLSRVSREMAYGGRQVPQTALLLLDGDCIADKSHLQRLQSKAKGIQLFISQPCIEALFLTFLEPTRDWRTEDAGTIKRHFHRSYLQEGDKVEPTAYASLPLLQPDALISACRAREYGHCTWAYDYMAQLLNTIFSEDLIGNAHGC